MFFLSGHLHWKIEELLFWLEIMGDHARLIKGSIKPGNTNMVMVVDNFIQLFDRYGQKVKHHPELEPDFLKELNSTALSFREMKREMLGAALRRGQVTSFGPTFFNHVFSEVEEFLHCLSDWQQEEAANGNNLMGYHLLWILDMAEHAAFLNGALDKVEYFYREETKAFESAFDKMYLKAVEIAGYYRSDPASVQPVLRGLDRQMKELTRDFGELLNELKEKAIAAEVAGDLNPLLPDHMAREARYYLQKIAEF